MTYQPGVVVFFLLLQGAGLFFLSCASASSQARQLLDVDEAKRTPSADCTKVFEAFQENSARLVRLRQIEPRARYRLAYCRSGCDVLRKEAAIYTEAVEHLEEAVATLRAAQERCLSEDRSAALAVME